MARRRTGCLSLRPRKGVLVWHALVTVGQGAETRREWYSLETVDRSVAKRKLKRLVGDLRQGDDPEAAAKTAASPDSVSIYAEAWVQRREAQGLSCAKDER